MTVLSKTLHNTRPETLLETNFASENIPKNSLEVKQRGRNNSGIFLIQPQFVPRPFLELCKMTRRGGGWTYLLNRYDGSLNFDLDWNSYKQGFGNLGGEFWLGLDNIHYLTGYQVNELLIEFETSNKADAYANYKYFSVGDGKEGYPLKLLSGFSGNVKDRFSYHAARKFTTKDKDQDLSEDKNCAEKWTGGWWYNECHEAHLTGEYGQNASSSGAYWDFAHPFKKAKMLVRPQLD